MIMHVFIVDLEITPDLMLNIFISFTPYLLRFALLAFHFFAAAFLYCIGPIAANVCGTDAVLRL